MADVDEGWRIWAPSEERMRLGTMLIPGNRRTWAWTAGWVDLADIPPDRAAEHRDLIEATVRRTHELWVARVRRRYARAQKRG